MKIKIHDGDTKDSKRIADSIIIEADTIEEIENIAKKEIKKRGWKNCWSEIMEITKGTASKTNYPYQSR